MRGWPTAAFDRRTALPTAFQQAGTDAGTSLLASLFVPIGLGTVAEWSWLAGIVLVGLGLVVVASLFWDRTTDAAAFWGLTVGLLAPALFVLATGAFQAAPVVGLVPTAAVLVAVSLLTGSSGRP